MLSVISMETGWIVTEVGRQPWVVVGYLLTRDAVTTRGDLWLIFGLVILIYAATGVATVLLLRAMRRRWSALTGDEVPVPYGPEPELVAAATSGTER